MQNTAAKSASAAVELKDARLFREACYLDGQWVQAKSGQMINVDNPATGEIIGRVPKLGGAETKQAIEAANRAFPAWSKKTAKERAAVLRRWFDLMMANQEDLARLMTLEQGKPLAESKGEVAYAAAFLEWFGEEAKRVYGDTIPQHQAGKRIVVIKQPIGVVACITPLNFPLAMITRKAGPAIAAGCTVVLKPASQTPFSALALAELAERAGVPKGVLNVVDDGHDPQEPTPPAGKCGTICNFFRKLFGGDGKPSNQNGGASAITIPFPLFSRLAPVPPAVLGVTGVVVGGVALSYGITNAQIENAQGREQLAAIESLVAMENARLLASRTKDTQNYLAKEQANFLDHVGLTGSNNPDPNNRDRWTRDLLRKLQNMRGVLERLPENSRVQWEKAIQALQDMLPK
jgi:hypothetical protein